MSIMFFNMFKQATMRTSELYSRRIIPWQSYQSLTMNVWKSYGMNPKSLGTYEPQRKPSSGIFRLDSHTRTDNGLPVICTTSNMDIGSSIYVGKCRGQQSKVDLQPLDNCFHRSHRHYSSGTETNKPKFNIFYQFPHVIMLRALSRLKIYQTAGMAVLLPFTKYMEITGDITSQTFWSCTGMTGFSCVMLYVVSHFFRRLVGLMSFNESEGIVKVSHLTFWGRRKDILIPVDEIVPLADLGEEVYDIYIKLRRYDSEEYLLYTIRYGYIKDMEVFKKVFGETWQK